MQIADRHLNEANKFVSIDVYRGSADQTSSLTSPAPTKFFGCDLVVDEESLSEFCPPLVEASPLLRLALLPRGSPGLFSSFTFVLLLQFFLPCL